MWPQEEQSRGRERRDQSGLAYEQTGGDGHAHPAIFQNIHGQAGAARGEIAVDAQIVIHAREGGFDGRRLRFAFGGVRPGVQRAVLVDRQNNPSGRMCGGLCGRIRHKEEQNSEKETEELGQSGVFLWH